MADDKEKQDEGGKKSPIMSLVLVAVGAGIGGAGVVMMNPAKEHKPEAPKPRELLEVRHEKPFEFQVNPRDPKGARLVRFEMSFKYVVDESRGSEAVQRVEANWDDAHSACLIYLKSRTLAELRDASNAVVLQHGLQQILTEAFFPEDEPVLDGEGVPTGKYKRMASVNKVNFKNWLYQ